MCEKRTRKIKKGSSLMRLRETRRLQRLQRQSSPPAPELPRACQPSEVPRPCQPSEVPRPCQPSEVPRPCQPPAAPHGRAQSRLLLELAWKTVALMHRNKIIQQKIVALQKETSEFVASVMNHPENRQRYMERLRLHKLAQQAQAQPPNIVNNNLPLKVEPTN